MMKILHASRLAYRLVQQLSSSTDGDAALCHCVCAHCMTWLPVGTCQLAALVAIYSSVVHSYSSDVDC